MLRILILDDDPVSTLVLEEMLRKLGHEVDKAAAGGDAWELMRKGPPDLLLLDTDLGGERGWEFLQRIRTDVVFAALPVVVYSGITQREIVQRYLKLGVQGMLVKPCSEARLAQEIERANRTPFRAAIFEPLPSIMARTGMEAESVAALYRQAADEVWGVLGHAAPLAAEPFNPPALARLFSLKGCGVQIGCSVLQRMIEEALRAYNRMEAGPIRRAVDHLPVIVRLLRREAGEIAPLPSKPPEPEGETVATVVMPPGSGVGASGNPEANTPAAGSEAGPAEETARGG
jgi:CheY-like chemotaxis protein